MRCVVSRAAAAVAAIVVSTCWVDLKINISVIKNKNKNLTRGSRHVASRAPKTVTAVAEIAVSMAVLMY